MSKLYQFTREDLKPRFAFVKDNIIQNQLPYYRWQEVSSEDILMKIGSLDLSEKTAVSRACASSSVAMASSSPRRARPAPTAARAADYKEFWKHWKKNQTIPGNVFLHPNGKLIWISEIDLKYFEEV